MDFLSSCGAADFVIAECDGSRGRSLKCYGDHEPPVPQSCGCVLAVAGVNALGKKADEDNIFRSEEFRSLYGLKDEEMELTDYKPKDCIKSVLEKYKYSIVNDGFLSVGIAFDKEIIEEVFIESFKYLRVYTSQKDKLDAVLEKYNLKENPNLRFIDEFIVCSETVADDSKNVLHPDDIVKALDNAF